MQLARTNQENEMQNVDTTNDDEACIRRIMAVFARKHEMSFDDVVCQYREIEAEFVARAGDDEAKVLERKQSITNHLLMDAENSDQPHEVCREIWEELVQRGFMSRDLKHTLSNSYARCCQWNGEFDAGLAVLEPLVAELESLLAQTTLTPNERAFCKQFLEIHTPIRDELEAGIRARLVGRRGKWTPDEIALTQRMNAVYVREHRNGLSFEDALGEYRQIEAEFVERVGHDASQSEETKRCITASILQSAYEHEQPHEVCRTIWEELAQLGFSDKRMHLDIVDLYVACCLFNGEPDAGLAVVEPLLAELQQHVDAGTDEDMPSERYPEEIALLADLRDQLNALQ